MSEKKEKKENDWSVNLGFVIGKDGGYEGMRTFPQVSVKCLFVIVYVSLWFFGEVIYIA